MNLIFAFPVKATTAGMVICVFQKKKLIPKRWIQSLYPEPVSDFRIGLRCLLPGINCSFKCGKTVLRRPLPASWRSSEQNKRSQEPKHWMMKGLEQSLRGQEQNPCLVYQSGIPIKKKSVGEQEARPEPLRGIGVFPIGSGIWFIAQTNALTPAPS